MSFSKPWAESMSLVRRTWCKVGGSVVRDDGVFRVNTSLTENNMVTGLLPNVDYLVFII